MRALNPHVVRCRSLGLALGVMIGATGCPTSTPSDDDDDEGVACALGRFTVSSVLFEESGCLDVVGRDGGGITVAFSESLSWRVDGFSADLEPGVLDDTNSSATGRYEREGLVWVAFTGAIGGQPLGESTATIDTLDDASWQGTIDGVAVPDGGNDSLESVFITIVAGE